MLKVVGTSEMWPVYSGSGHVALCTGNVELSSVCLGQTKNFFYMIWAKQAAGWVLPFDLPVLWEAQMMNTRVWCYR